MVFDFSYYTNDELISLKYTLESLSDDDEMLEAVRLEIEERLIKMEGDKDADWSGYPEEIEDQSDIDF
jgi:hypothetical protein